jgi:hypothetical protein
LPLNIITYMQYLTKLRLFSLDYQQGGKEGLTKKCR